MQKAAGLWQTHVSYAVLQTTLFISGSWSKTNILKMYQMSENGVTKRSEWNTQQISSGATGAQI
jgi:hypothetical protein